MSETVVHTRLPKSVVLRRLRRIPSDARQGGPADVILFRAGDAVSKRVHKAFLVKSRGGTDECGNKWQRLAYSTVTKRLRKLAPTREQDRPSSSLNPGQRDRWWEFYRRALVRVHDKSAAARIAWAQLKRGGGLTLKDRSARSIPILIDDGDLLLSLRPNSSSSHKIFRVSPGVAELGTDAQGAAASHKGTARQPQRRLWPRPNEWTSSWWEEVLVAGRTGVIDLILEKLK